jgi:hypothetical protein
MKGKAFREPVFHRVVNGQITQFREIISENKLDFAIKNCGIDNIKIVPLKMEEYIKKSDYGNVFGIKDKHKPFRCYYDCVRPRLKPGETVYLKEPYGVIDDAVFYKHVEKDISGLKEWENKITMPGEYARYFIEITGVRAERLKDISDSDCVKRGIRLNPHYDDDVRNEKILIASNHYIVAYADLIDEIHGKGTWDSNPFVWVYDFKLTAK